jgi:hypothetical protein
VTVKAGFIVPILCNRAGEVDVFWQGDLRVGAGRVCSSMPRSVSLKCPHAPGCARGTTERARSGSLLWNQLMAGAAGAIQIQEPGILSGNFLLSCRGGNRAGLFSGPDRFIEPA